MVDVAVVIPAHQAAGHIGQALASVAAQMLPAAEVVVVDDGSTDDTAAVARAWEGRLPLRTVVLANGEGPAAARHEGIVSTGAPLVALLDADDVWLPDHLATMLDVYERWHGLVTADALRWVPGAALDTRPESARLPVPTPGAARQLHALLRRNFVFTGTLFARELYDRAGGFRRELRVAEDWDLWIRMVRLGAVVSRPDHPTVLRRLRAGSASDGGELQAAQEAVLRLAVAEAADPAEARATRQGLRAIAATAALLRSYDLATADEQRAARRVALSGLRGPVRIAARAALVVAAPRTAARRRNALRRHPWWWTRR